ncbi:4-amino-4-deoxychorismate lyase [Acinetobacter calcoaceticus]|uniref:Aminodeoxychorismate lyase n=1 Tax=Acinetobacter calcoaceticus TaxID=471 RepID=A0A4R1XZD6_ACICA|nr:4-amino-4-deoxychorismate lyase [Acinetobacter calcoaceticus]
MVQCLKNMQYMDAAPIMDRAFHYGDGCFTTARIYENTLLLKQRHWARLSHAGRQLSLKFDLALIEQSLKRLSADHGQLNGTIKVLISRGYGDRGYSLPMHDADIYVFYYPNHLGLAAAEYIDSGLLQQQMGLCMPSLVGLKSLNRLEQVLLKQEADQQGWVEALVSDVRQHIVEGVSSNCFIRLQDEWITPDLGYNGVHGVMRAEILARMQQRQLNCSIRSVDLSEVDQIQSLFFCNALSPMKIVQRLATRTLATQPCVELFQTLQLDHFNSYVENQI